MLTLYVYDPVDADVDAFPPASALTTSEFLAQPPSWRPRLDKIIVLFSGISMSSNDDINAFGMLQHVLVQLTEAADRLAHHKPALLRTCIYSEPLFFIFEPDDDVTRFSSLGLLPPPYNGYYPAADSPNHFNGVDQRQALYAFVAAHNVDPRWKEGLTGNLPLISGIEYPTASLIAAIQQQVMLGHRLIEDMTSQPV